VKAKRAVIGAEKGGAKYAPPNGYKGGKYCLLS
jgi:hypothetical protein